MSAAAGPAAARARLRPVAFVVRCTGSALLAAVTAGALGLGHPVWAVVSALVVSQDSAGDTGRAFLWRVAATVAGVLVAVAVGSTIVDPWPEHPVQLAAAVAICAGIARRWPMLRVCMWTAPIVLMTATPDGGVGHAAIERGSEVIVGAALATALHWIVDRALGLVSGPPSTGRAPPRRT